MLQLNEVSINDTRDQFQSLSSLSQLELRRRISRYLSSYDCWFHHQKANNHSHFSTSTIKKFHNLEGQAEEAEDYESKKVKIANQDDNSNVIIDNFDGRAAGSTHKYNNLSTVLFSLNELVILSFQKYTVTMNQKQSIYFLHVSKVLSHLVL